MNSFQEHYLPRYHVGLNLKTMYCSLQRMNLLGPFICSIIWISWSTMGGWKTRRIVFPKLHLFAISLGHLGLQSSIIYDNFQHPDQIWSYWLSVFLLFSNYYYIGNWNVQKIIRVSKTLDTYKPSFARHFLTHKVVKQFPAVLSNCPVLWTHLPKNLSSMFRFANSISNTWY